MEKHEIFNQAIEQFKDRNKEDLLSIGITIGSNHSTFRKLYTAYITNKAKYENKPRIGAKIKVEFNRSEDEVLIKRAPTELKFNTKEFMDYLNLVSICFGDIYPLGSIVELDDELFAKEYKRSSGVKEGERSWVVIVSRFVPANEADDQHFIEYVATPYPHGEGTMFLNRMTIRGVVHSGLTDESEEEYVQQLRENLVVSNKKSFAFLTDEELDALFQPKNMNENMVYGEVC